MKKLVCYYRVSSRKQERSGLGLEGQRAAVEAYAEVACGEVRMPKPNGGCSAQRNTGSQRRDQAQGRRGVS
jgi:hypothetical protein